MIKNDILYLAFDTSTSCTGVTAYFNGKIVISSLQVPTVKVKGKPREYTPEMHDFRNRIVWQACLLESILNMVTRRILGMSSIIIEQVVVAIEEYAFGAKFRLSYTAEASGVYNFLIRKILKINPLMVPSTSWKKFVGVIGRKKSDIKKRFCELFPKGDNPQHKGLNQDAIDSYFLLQYLLNEKTFEDKTIIPIYFHPIITSDDVQDYFKILK